MFLLNPIAISCHFLTPQSFTSHYVPIKSKSVKPSRFIRYIFTSHYVPIKSITTAETLTLRRVFTSHYVPIKSPCTLIYNPNHQSLHPIMFLLNQNIFPPRRLRGQNFTSHYVPIKSFVSKYR